MVRGTPSDLLSLGLFRLTPLPRVPKELFTQRRRHPIPLRCEGASADVCIGPHIARLTACDHAGHQRRHNTLVVGLAQLLAWPNPVVGADRDLDQHRESEEAVSRRRALKSPNFVFA